MSHVKLTFASLCRLYYLQIAILRLAMSLSQQFRLLSRPCHPCSDCRCTLRSLLVSGLLSFSSFYEFVEALSQMHVAPLDVMLLPYRQPSSHLLHPALLAFAFSIRFFLLVSVPSLLQPIHMCFSNALLTTHTFTPLSHDRVLP